MAIVILLFAAMAAPACAQDTETMVIQKENVSTDHARVLRVEPVYQTLRATSMVERCDQSTPVDDAEPRRGLARVIGAVKDALTPGSDDDEATETVEAAEPGEDPADGCRIVPMEREFQRPIAYDVDYVYHGVRYRSRLPYDPGNRVRIRVSITPIVPPIGDR